jgi:large repetitive protein
MARIAALLVFFLALGIGTSHAEIFPPNCAGPLPSGWSTPAGATTGWSIVTDISAEGSCSLRSNAMTDSSAEGLYNRAQVQFTGEFSSGTIRFFYKVSTEEGYDCLRFFVDGSPQTLDGTCEFNHGGMGASGLSEWKVVDIPVTGGTRTLVWSYEKDFSESQGLDAAWIDGISLPLATPIFTSGLPPNGTVGTAYTHTFTATGSPAPTFSISGNVPAGLALNATTGVYSGTPTQAGSFTATASATNAGGTGFQTFTFLVAATVPGAPQNVSAVGGNSLAVVSFSPPASDGGSVVTSYTATCNPGGVSASRAASPITVAGLLNGTTYTCSVTATNSAGTGPASASVNVMPSAVAPLTLAEVQSRKTHGAAGTFDLPIDESQAIGGNVTVEPRAIGTGHRIVFQFNGAITATGTATCLDATNAPVGSVSAAASGNDVVVTLTGVPDAKRVTVSLSNVNNAGVNVSVSLGFLLGDVNNSRATTAADILLVKGQSAKAVNASNFLDDLNLTGGITATDILAVKGRSGQGL